MKVKKVLIDELIPGMKLAENFYGMDQKRLLLKKGTQLSKELIAGLFKKDIMAILIEIPDDSEEISIQLPLPPDAKKVKGIPFTFPESVEERIFINLEGKILLKIDDPQILETKKKAVSTAHEILKGVSTGRKVNRQSAEKVAQQLIKSISENKSAFVNIAGIRMIDEYTFVHSVNVAAYTTIIAMAHGIMGKDLETICTGAFLHDVGKMLIDPDILNKPGKLTDSEFEQIKTHSQKGYDLLRENGIDEVTAMLAKGHHERYDGSGYPSGLDEKNSPVSIQMAAIADVYDALTSNRVYKRAMGSSEAMKIIVSETGKHFQPEMVSLFQRSIGIYPIGSLVVLSNGYIARVLDQCEGIVRPIVQLLHDREGKNIEDRVVLNLMDNEEIYITEAIKETVKAA